MKVLTGLIITGLGNMAYADSGISTLMITGTIQPQASIVVVSNRTIYISGRTTPGLPGNYILQEVDVTISCSNGMLLQMLLDSQNSFALRSANQSSFTVPYSITVSNVSNQTRTTSTIISNISCTGSNIDVPIEISTGDLPAGLATGSYSDILMLGLSY